MKVIAAYGGRCICCGERHPAFLSIDHINGDGKQHRKEVHDSRIYRWLKKHNYPKNRFQLLCYNCNIAKYHNNNVCPHRIPFEKITPTETIISAVTGSQSAEVVI